MAITELQQQHINFVTGLFQEGFLDEQFTQLQQLQDESNPHFVQEVTSLFFQESSKLLASLQKTVNQEPVDYKNLESCLNRFKGSSSSIGAQRLKNVCIVFRSCCEVKRRNECLQCLQELKQEYDLLMDKLEFLFELEQQILRAGGTISLIT